MNIQYVTLTDTEASTLSKAALHADFMGRDMHIMLKGSGLCYKVGGGMWSAPMGMVTWTESYVPRHRRDSAAGGPQVKCLCEADEIVKFCPLHDYSEYPMQARHRKPVSTM